MPRQRRTDHAEEIQAVSSADGYRLWAPDGRELADFTSFFGVALIGHGHPAVVSAITKQASRLVHSMGSLFECEEAESARSVLRRFTDMGDASVLLFTSGAEAIETAVKIAQGVTGRHGIAVLEGGFHGVTLGTLALCGHDDLRSTVPYIGVRELEVVPWRVCTGQESVEDWIAGVDWRSIGCLIVEPMQNLAGYRFADRAAISSIATSARASGALVIVDEIFTGGGRCGAPLASRRILGSTFEFDLVCVGKALGGGIPFAACLVSPDLARFAPTGSMIGTIGSTFSANPLACAVVPSVVSVIESEAIIERVLELEAIFAGHSSQIRASRYVRDYRGSGAAWAVEFAPSAEGRETASHVARRLLQERSVLVLTTGSPLGNIVSLCPPAQIPADLVEDVLGFISTYA